MRFYEYHASDETVGTPYSRVSARKLWRHLRDTTTSHGFPQYNTTRGYLKKACWVVMTLVCMLGLAYQLSEVVRRFISWPVNVNIQEYDLDQVYADSELEFPAVTICNMNPIKSSAIKDSPAIESLLSTSDKSRKKRDIPAIHDSLLYVVTQAGSRRNRNSPIAGIQRSPTPSAASSNREQDRPSIISSSSPASHDLVHPSIAKSAADGSITTKNNVEKNDVDENDTYESSHLGVITRRKRYADFSLGCIAEFTDSSTGWCYGLVGGGSWDMDYEAARDECINHGGMLTLIANAAQMAFITNHPTLFQGIVVDENDYYIFLRNGLWADTYPKEAGSYSNYVPSPGSNPCVIGQMASQKWRTSSCTHTCAALCQKMVQCPYPVYVHPDGSTSCYFILDSTSATTWAKAEALCPLVNRDKDVHLAELDTQDKVSHVHSSGALSGSFSHAYYWIYLKDEGSWNWRWQKSTERASYTNWGFNQPEGSSTRDYVFADISTTKWRCGVYDNFASTVGAAHVLCEMKGVLYVEPYTPTTTTTTTPKPTTVMTTTQEKTTVFVTTPKETTQPDTTVIMTTPQETTTQPETTVVETTLQDTTTQPETTVVETTLQDTTTQQETTVVETTRQETTTQLETTVVETTPQDTTTQQKTTIVETTLQETTTQQETTIVETTLQDTTTQLETTVVETTPQETTTQPETTVVETTPQETTTQPETTVVETTPQETTTQPETTVVETTPQETTTQLETTVAETTAQETTTQLETTVVETTPQPETMPGTTIASEPTSSTPAPTATKPLETIIEELTATPAPLQGSAFPERKATRESFQLEETLTETLAELDVNAKSQLGYQPWEFIVDCQYDGVYCSAILDFEQFYNSAHGNCYIFNAGWNSTMNIRKSRRPGRKNGLVVTINIGQSEYTESVGGPAGARVVIHGPGVMPHPEEQGVLVRPGELTAIRMFKVSNITQKVIQRLDKPYGDCVGDMKDYEKDVFSEIYPVNYSRIGCFKTCYQGHVMKQCGCYDASVPSKGAAFDNAVLPVCSITNITLDDCKYNISNQYVKGELGCEKQCPSACNDRFFMPKLSTSVWPSDAEISKVVRNIKKNIANLVAVGTKKVYRDNLLQIEVFYKDFTYEITQETPSYSPIKFMADIGGNLGLFLGFSMLTIFEFMEFGLDNVIIFILWCVYGKCAIPECCVREGTVVDDESAIKDDRGVRSDKGLPTIILNDVTLDRNTDLDINQTEEDTTTAKSTSYNQLNTLNPHAHQNENKMTTPHQAKHHTQDEVVLDKPSKSIPNNRRRFGKKIKQDTINKVNPYQRKTFVRVESLRKRVQASGNTGMGTPVHNPLAYV